MKFLFKTLIILIAIYLGLKGLFYIFNDGHEITYNVGNFNVSETLKTKDNNYYFELKNGKIKLNFQIFENYHKSSKVITKILHKKIDGYECILPIFKNGEIYTDVMCLKNNTITYAHNLKNKSIRNYVKTLKKQGYDSQKYRDKGEKTNLSNTLTIYENNLLENNYVAMENYKGLELLSKGAKTVNIFENDVYTKPISIFTDKYYVVADYTDEYTFQKFYVVNIINGDTKEIRSYDEISFDSYIMGAVDGEIYLFDKDAQIEYKINLERETVEQFADKDNLKTYNGKWTKITLMEALDGTYFDNYHTNKIKGYTKAVKPNDYYYYIYNQDGDVYHVYRADVQNPKIKTYLFDTTNLNSIIYQKDVIYYQYQNSYYYYNENGQRKIIDNTELEFNSDITLGAYVK